MDEGEVNDPIGPGGANTQAIEVVERPAMDLCSGGDKGIRRGIRASEPDDLVAGGEKFRDDCGTDETGRTGDEYAHGKNLQVPGCLHAKACVMTSAVISIAPMSTPVITYTQNHE
jgi:hypothetical protein